MLPWPDEEHIRILKAGVEAWNTWRTQNPLVRPSLRQADLFNSKLAGIDLHDGYLPQAILVEVSFEGANLRGADLREANLSDASLRSADLSRALLNGANLDGADLDGANLDGAWLGRAVLGNNDLRSVKGLESVVHQSGSVLGMEALRKSKGIIPVTFLRGCGLQDWEIEAAKLYNPELTLAQVSEVLHGINELRANQPIQFYSCFISYSTKDEEFARRLYADLQDRGVRCWFAPADLRIGDRFRDRIDESIHLHDKLLLILSDSSVSSPWVRDEVEAAFEREQRENRTVLFPIRIDSAVMETREAWAASIRRTRHVGDFTPWKDQDAYAKTFERLLQSLKPDVEK